MEHGDGTAQEIGLKEFDPRWIKPNATVAVISKRGNGKSTLMKDLMFFQRSAVGAAVVFSETEGDNGFYSTFIPSSFIYDKIDEAALLRIIDRQRTVKQAPPNSPNFNPNLIVLVDDVFADKTVFNSAVLRSYVLQGRHWPVGFWMGAQYPNDIPKGLRMNIDWVFVLRENQATCRKVLYENFFSVFQSPAMFAQALETYSENFGCLVLNNTERSNDLTKTVFWYRANPNRPDWRLGRDMWKFHEQYYLHRAASLPKQVDWSAAQPLAKATTLPGKRSTAGGKKNQQSVNFVFLDRNGQQVQK